MSSTGSWRVIALTNQLNIGYLARHVERAVWYCEAKLQFCREIAELVQQIRRWVNFYLGKERSFIKDEYWQAFQYITAANDVIQFQGQGTVVRLETIRKELEAGRILEGRAVIGSPLSPSIGRYQILAHHHYLLRLDQHINILHAALYYLAKGNYIGLKVSVRVLLQELL